MPQLTLEGNTLGERHKHFNKLVQDSVTNKQFSLTKINYDENDLDNLLKIDTASKTRNVDYIIDVLKCDDMLYVSRAIKQSTWLITEQEYSHIINPEYLHTQLFPHMLSKAINKLLLHIRLHLKNEKRVEAFYNYFKDISNEANKWLLTCSIPFVENLLQNEGLTISIQLFKRLCKRSIVFLKYYTKLDSRKYWNAVKAVKFLIKSNTEEFLNFLESFKSVNIPLSRKYTETVMKKFPNRIIDNFDMYKNNVDLSVVAKHMKKEDIKDFLLRSMKNDKIKYFLSIYENLEHFIKNMPDEVRFEFVKKTFIDKTENGELIIEATNTYEWYQYAPFDVAFTELKKLIRAESSSAERCAMLSVLITCARNNSQHIKTLLQHFYDKHRNEPAKFKIQFINNVINQISTHEFDSETWNILNNLFHSVEVYIESGSENASQTCLKSIILYHVLHNESIPEIVEKKVLFDTFKKFRSKLNEDQQNKMFSYLLNFISTTIQNKTTNTESDFISVLFVIKDFFNLLHHWKKDIRQYAFIRDKIRELIVTNKQNSWDIDLSSLYKGNKLWQRHLFEESVLLCPNEEVCLNALKHKPQLLARYSVEVDALRAHNISLKRLLDKLRIYWPDSFAQQWIDAYLNDISHSTEHKALIKGLLVLLTHRQTIDLVKKYVPPDSKIEWSEVDQQYHPTEFNVFSIRKNIAKCLHIARPQISLEAVMWYAKGDYLQYVVPSLNAILYNISRIKSRDHLSKLLDAPVSLQKHGLRLAFIKLKYDELKPIFTDIWKSTKNSTIRTHLFTYTYNMLCKEKETSVARELWELLSTFIDNLTPDENVTIFQNLGEPSKVHTCVQGDFLMKSYDFLSSLPAAANCENHKMNLIHYASNIMHLLDADFIADRILADIEEKISISRCEYIDILTSFVLHGKTEDEQCERSKRSLVPALKCAFKSWNVIKDNSYIMKVNVDKLIASLTWNFRRFSCKKTIILPIKLFSEIKIFMEQNLSVEENYERYTTWKLTSEYIKLVAEHKDMLNDSKLDNLPSSDFDTNWLPDEAENVWEALHIKISPKLGQIVVRMLKDDTEKYFSTIYLFFSSALSMMFSNLSLRRSSLKIETLKYMVLNEDYIPSYLVVCEEVPKYGNIKEKVKILEIRQMLAKHPSKEVQMHYQRVFGNIAD